MRRGKGGGLMAICTGSSPLLLGGAASMAVAGALTADVAFGEHPTHSVVLGAVVVLVATLKRLGGRAIAAFPAVSAALATQPMLHLVSQMARPQTVEHVTHNHWDLRHLVVSEVPTAGVQIAVPALAVVAMMLGAHLLHLLIDGVRRPLAPFSTPSAPPHVLNPVRARRLGSMLRWCGWAIRAARRGPPHSAR
jgi:hypothetical protein